MIARLLCCTLVLGLGSEFAVRAPAAAIVVPDYHIGDRATSDVVTPLPLVVVVNSSRTNELRRLALERVPVVFFQCTNAVEEAQAGFRLTFDDAHSQFLAALERTFKRRTLPAVAVAGERFARFIGSFQKLHRGFPLVTNLAVAWARGESDESFRADWGLQLRAATSRYLRPDLWPEGSRTGPAHVVVVGISSTNVPVPLAAVAQAGVLVHRTNLVAVSKARQELAEAFPPGEVAIGKFLAGLVKPNCVFSESLTEAGRAKRAGPLVETTEYQPGQLVVKAGARVDDRAKAALDQLRARLALAEARPDPGSAQEQLLSISRLTRWLLAATLALALLVALALWQLARTRAAGSLLPARLDDTVAPGPANPAALAWQQRALVAEQRADKAAQLVKAGLLPQLARWLSDKLVRGLMTQRSELLEVQRQAARDIEELEARLSRMQAPVAERLSAYEQRIAELERQLAMESAKNRALLEAKVGLIRQRLAAEQARQQAGYN